MESEELRKEAIQRRLCGESPQIICRRLGVSRKWFYKWWNRYQSGNDSWYKNESRAPKHIPHKLEPSMEALILSIRDTFVKTPYSQKGAAAIAWEVHKLGHPAPAYWQINRVLKRNNRIHPKSHTNRKNSNIAYPYFRETYYPGYIHQADLVGPRYIKGDGQLFVLNTIDLYSRAVHSFPIRSKDDDSIVLALIDTWKKLGIPEFLQLDNELSFRGSNKYPHSLGKVIKLCLSLNIQPVFIPPAEPWRNGVIERFNDTFDVKFYRRERFENFAHLKCSLINFLNFHNHKHLYTATGGKTPQQVLDNETIKPTKLTVDYYIPTDHISDSMRFDEILNIPDEGYIHLIRFIRSDLALNIWGERFKMPKETMYQYLRATIYTEFHLLNVFLDNKLVAQFEYRLPTINQADPTNVIKEIAHYLKKLGIDYF